MLWGKRPSCRALDCGCVGLPRKFNLREEKKTNEQERTESSRADYPIGGCLDCVFGVGVSRPHDWWRQCVRRVGEYDSTHEGQDRYTSGDARLRDPLWVRC